MGDHKGLIIFIIILVLASIITAIVLMVVIPGVKRSKLAAAWADIAKKANMNLTQDYIQTELKKVSNADIDTLITFSQALQAKTYGPVIAMLPAVSKILNQTNLGNVQTYLAALIGAPKT